MKILHYALGFPPYRSGGLTKCCTDLMYQQICDGDEVAMLWPGEILCGKKTRIKQHKSINGAESFEIINPIPVSYDEGIKSTAAFMKTGDYTCYLNFLKTWQPNVIHIHTLMGLHKNFLQAAKDRGIKLVFTAHDFFPLCPKVTLFKNGRICDGLDCAACAACNSTALSQTKLKIMQSALYRCFKDYTMVKKLRRQHRENFLLEISVNDVKSDNTDAEKYKQLKKHFKSMLQCMDIIHYNSTLTKEIYQKHICTDNVVIPLTHADIGDNFTDKVFQDNVRITYPGPNSIGKGYQILRQALDELWLQGKRFTLNIFFTPETSAPYININERYTYMQLESIFNSTDILAVPSVMYESFGYTAAEALSYGVPLLITENVGAKDIIPERCRIKVSDISVDGIKEAVLKIDKYTLETIHNAIKAEYRTFKIRDFSSEIKKNCYL